MSLAALAAVVGRLIIPNEFEDDRMKRVDLFARDAFFTNQG
jgi:hypothetical protein